MPAPNSKRDSACSGDKDHSVTDTTHGLDVATHTPTDRRSVTEDVAKSDVDQKKAISRPTPASRVNPTRLARRASIILGDEDGEYAPGRGRKAPIKKVADDSSKAPNKKVTADKAPRKRKADATTNETNAIPSGVTEQALKGKKRKNADEDSGPVPPLINQAAKRRLTAKSVQPDSSISPTPPPARDLSDIVNIGGLDVPEVEDNEIGTGVPISIGSKVEVYYTMKIWEMGAYRMLRSLTSVKPPLRIVVGGQYDLYGLSEFLEGMRPGGERLIFVPPSHVPEIASISGVPNDTTLRLKVKLWRVSQAESSAGGVAHKETDAQAESSADGVAQKETDAQAESSAGGVARKETDAQTESSLDA
ncbi:peptidylprolyl isomerase fpr4 [Pleurotus pulmonarius]|nr:peptidylprolyl isomerase fpr4 [Pleurotus pulmonarius]KAF4579917.1 peptidylprolyl isomerase fpr4 [Pleurotus pulmonarius]